MSPVLAALAKTLRVERLEGSRLVLAVSGGADSLALLVGTAELREPFRLEPVVATVAHGLRPEARQEAEQVAAHAKRLGLPFELLEAPVAPGPGVEARAREARYAALERACRARGGVGVFTAHTASDQAETLLMHLARGSALRGARGVWRRRGLLVRPLLGVTREDILAFLAERSLVPAEDAMNRDPAYLRVRIREQVLPALEAAAGHAVAAPLARFAEQAAEDEAFLAGQADAARARLSVDGASQALDAVGLRALARPLRRRVLATLLEEAGVALAAPVMEAALEAVEAGGSAGLGRTHVLRCDGGTVRLQAQHPERAASGPAAARVPGAAGAEVEAHSDADGWPLPGLPEGPWLELPWAGLRLRLTATPPGEAEGLRLEGAPLAALGGPGSAGAVGYRVRRRRSGDRLGGEGGRKLQDLLVDARIPREARDQIPLVVDPEGRIVWVVGLWPRAALDGPAGGSDVKPGLWLVADPLEGTPWPPWLARRRGRRGEGARKARAL